MKYNLANAASHSVSTQQNIYLDGLRQTCKTVAANVAYQKMCYGDNSLSLDKIFINDEVSEKIAADRAAVEQMDRNQYLAQALAAQKRQHYSSKRTINDDVKYELFHLICEADDWNLSKAWDRDILQMYLTKSNPSHNFFARETLLLLLDYGLENGSTAAETLEENLVMLINTMAVDPNIDVEVGLFRTI